MHGEGMHAYMHVWHADLSVPVSRDSGSNGQECMEGLDAHVPSSSLAACSIPMKLFGTSYCAHLADISHNSSFPSARSRRYR